MVIKKATRGAADNDGKFERIGKILEVTAPDGSCKRASLLDMSDDKIYELDCK